MAAGRCSGVVGCGRPPLWLPERAISLTIHNRAGHRKVLGPLSFNARTTRRSIHPRLPHHPPHPAAKTADRLVAAQAWKSPWLVTLLEAYGGRLAIEATVEPSVTVRRNQRAKIPDKRENG